MNGIEFLNAIFMPRKYLPRLLRLGIGCIVALTGMVCPLCGKAAVRRNYTAAVLTLHAEPRRAPSGNMEALFSEEIQQATTKLKWRGETLSPDTIYALALTGASWQPAWGKEHLFSLAWGDSRKIPGYKQHSAEYAKVLRDVQASYERRDYSRVVGIASNTFSPDEISCDANLKELVGQSCLELRQPERAFPIFASPFEPSRIRQDSAEANRHFREGAFEAAKRAGLQKEAVAFGLSLLLEPGTQEGGVNTSALQYLESAGVDIDRILLGILLAPERLRGLPAYSYAAADLLVPRATPRLLPFLMHLAGTDDVYLKGRALLGMGIVAYRARRNDTPGWLGRVIASSALPNLREYGVSSGQRKMIADEIGKAVRSDNYRLRASGALALALLGEDADVPLLQKLALDRAYLLSPQSAERSSLDHSRRIMFPVRMAAAAALSRFGITTDMGSSELAGKDLDKARRGGQDVSSDRRNLRREIASQIVVSPIDVATAAPTETTKR